MKYRMRHRKNKSDMWKFVSTIFSLSFSDRVTTKLLSHLYGTGVFVAGIAAIALTFLGFTQSITLGLAALVISPVLFCLFVVAARVWAETTATIFEMSDIFKEITSSYEEEENAVSKEVSSVIQKAQKPEEAAARIHVVEPVNTNS